RDNPALVPRNLHFDRPSILFFFQAEDGIRDGHVTGVQTCALPISSIAALMELLNTLSDEEANLSRAALDQILPAVVLLIGPFARSEERRVGKEWRLRLLGEY